MGSNFAGCDCDADEAEGGDGEVSRFGMLFTIYNVLDITDSFNALESLLLVVLCASGLVSCRS